MDKYEYVLSELKRRGAEKQLVMVASATGISRRQIGNIMAGKNTGIVNINKLYEFLAENKKKGFLKDRKSVV